MMDNSIYFEILNLNGTVVMFVRKRKDPHDGSPFVVC